MLRNIGLLPKIIVAIILGILFGSFSPDSFIRVFATFNGIFGNFLSFVIPLIILGFIVPGIGSLGKGAGKLIGWTAAIAYFSTILAGTVAFFVGQAVLPQLLTGQSLVDAENPEEFLLSSYFEVEIPPIMNVVSALILAFVIGIGLSVLKEKALYHVFVDFQKIIEKLINNVIIPLLPFHIFGIFANMTFGGQVQTIVSLFAKVFVLIVILHITYLLILYLSSGTVAKKNPFQLLKTMSPAYFTALGTQSSAATIPVTLAQAKKTGVKESVAEFTIPLLANIHLAGSTITLVISSMGVMLLSGNLPTFAEYLPFILMLAVTMIAAPGVPGGAVMAALGLLEAMLHFDQTMISLMIALYLAQDSLGTATNVTGDGAITVFVNRWIKERKEKEEKVQQAG
ncbi:dicarboxylate/amino acid:cation symporter [Fervidibacillus halotolerans]|uniref:Dicarboxylate/amino acid:cation symporter n=1 Tax=Fervidibacillus halotolerans TaxID=2980027 RepID=A0A9E8RYC1_9BACI|nr:dicarboxylate/amino acid:cation symporter [Fervidibacillus halotolerans]WAA12059.1 dicarboxylate/amino acid:cation symporter [Fervidibacillus halotolerans]